ncbi:MAG: SPOR domain-containing protein [Candidatus Adiutrix sp.]|jgi:cell division septation protein DedD|nr:SPOR domain-containing protein [Candidatus Adiutrix sp.]
MADIFTRQRSLPPHRDGSGLNQRDQAPVQGDAILREVPPPEAAGPLVQPPPVAPAEAPRLSLSPPLPPSGAPPEAEPELGPFQRVAPTPLHTVIQALLLLFVLTWVFILGVVVGRGHLGESGPIHEGILWLEQKIGWQLAEEPLVVVRDTAPGSDEEVDWEEVRRLYQEEVAGAGRHPEVGLPAAGFQDAHFQEANDPPSLGYFSEEAPEPAATAEPASAPAAGRSQASSPVSPPPPATAERPAAATPPAAEPEAPQGRYAVQVALAFDEAEARRRVEKLQAQGLVAYYYRTEAGRFPVRAGRYLTRPEAEKAQALLEALGYRNHYLSTLTD